MVWYCLGEVSYVAWISCLSVPRVVRLSESVSGGAPGHGPAHKLLKKCCQSWVFTGMRCLGVGSGLPILSSPAGPVQHHRDTILDGWRNSVSADLCGRKGDRGGPHLDWDASVQLLHLFSTPPPLLMSERQRAADRHTLWWVWNGFLLGKV